MGYHVVTQTECAKQQRLSEELAQAIRALVEMQGSQIAALKLGDRQTSRFDEEINAVLRAWTNARRAYMEHLQDHGCLDG
jgi:hypothetical protein